MAKIIERTARILLSVLAVIVICGLLWLLSASIVTKQKAQEQLVGQTFSITNQETKSQVTFVIKEATNATSDLMLWRNKFATVLVNVSISKDPSTNIRIDRDPWDFSTRITLINDGKEFVIPSRTTVNGWEIYISYDGNFEVK